MRLCEPRGLALQPHINFHLSIFRLIDEELTFGGQAGLFRDDYHE